MYLVHSIPNHVNANVTSRIVKIPMDHVLGFVMPTKRMQEHTPSLIVIVVLMDITDTDLMIIARNFITVSWEKYEKSPNRILSLQSQHINVLRVRVSILDLVLASLKEM